ncbi:MAG: adenine nucleotide alpha hydrolase [Gammaproteobacteria bacterium SHHR-1]|uniref:adenine nucleotide alpha hydrolase n=1 Tax=Magnetovirga frankeli TaxID=947516 RepID=UPI001293297D|nr:adenine nucleotide alpha hydrolase [gamma proteobacterium SS-5]
MQHQTERLIHQLSQLLGQIGPLKLACSGGVDSLTLALLAHRSLGDQALICHAVSPAVPTEATARVQGLALRHGWRLQRLDAGEFADPNYLNNPYDRCFHCKSNLYAALERIAAEGGDATLVSGTNRDDLDDYRPGLIAARRFRVRHPYVECGIGKAEVRRIAAHLGQAELAELPASPCLASRVQTGLPIRAEHLGFVHQVERALTEALRPRVVRCRIFNDAISIQLDPESLQRLDAAKEHWRAQVQGLAAPLQLPGPVRFDPYRMGSAFVAEGESAP